MYNYGTTSLNNAKNLQPHLLNILMIVLETDDHSIDYGGRTPENQQKEFLEGDSKVPGFKEDGSINDFAHRIQVDGYAYAVDVCPWLDGKKLATSEEDFGPNQMAQFAWFLRRVSEVGRIYFADLEQRTGERWKLRFGINWDGDKIILTDQNFQDWFHIEILKLSGG